MTLLHIILPFSALFLDRLFGELPTRIHPICVVGTWAIQIENLLRKGKNGKNMFWRGFFAWIFVLMPCLCFVIFTTLLPLLCPLYFFSDRDGFHIIGYFFSCLIALFWTWVCLAPRSLSEHAKRVAKPLEENNLPKAQKELSMIVGRNTSILDAFAVARACIESVAENLTDGVLSTLFWALFAMMFCFGLHYLYDFFSPHNSPNNVLYFTPIFIVIFITVHRITNILDAMWGKKNEKYINFGTMSAITDDILNYVPARLGLFCVSFACFFVKNCSAQQSLRIALIYKNAHESPNSAWTESAFAGALNLKLGGPAHYIGISVNHPYLGEGTLEATAENIYTSIKLMWTSSIIFTCLMSFLTHIAAYTLFNI